MEPISYHTGLKANYAFSDKVNATIEDLVNGWNVDTDNNSQKTILVASGDNPDQAKSAGASKACTATK